MKCPTPCKRTARPWFDTPFNREVGRCHPQTGKPDTRRANAHMTAKHRKWPMGTVVRVFFVCARVIDESQQTRRFRRRGGVVLIELPVTIHGHTRDHPSRAWCTMPDGVTVDGRTSALVPFARMRRVKDGVHVHPEWMVQHDQRIEAERLAARAARQARNSTGKGTR